MTSCDDVCFSVSDSLLRSPRVWEKAASMRMVFLNATPAPSEKRIGAD